MDSLVAIVDVVGLAAFLVAVAVVRSIPVRRESLIGGATKWFMVAAMATYVFVMFSNVLEHTGLTDRLDLVEDYIELLFAPLVFYSAHSLVMRQSLNDALRSQRQLRSTHELLESIVSTAPAGILILDDRGHITYANDTACRVLDLAEDSSTGGYRNPGWVAQDARAPHIEPSPDLGVLVGSDEQASVPLVIEWPTGWRVRITAASKPMQDSLGRVGGFVVAFQEQPS